MKPRNEQWSPAQYDKFRAERMQPFFDLLALIRRRENMRIVDLGCGTRELPFLMLVAFRQAFVLGCQGVSYSIE